MATVSELLEKEASKDKNRKFTTGLRPYHVMRQPPESLAAELRVESGAGKSESAETTPPSPIKMPGSESLAESNSVSARHERQPPGESSGPDKISGPAVSAGLANVARARSRRRKQGAKNTPATSPGAVSMPGPSDLPGPDKQPGPDKRPGAVVLAGPYISPGPGESTGGDAQHDLNTCGGPGSLPGPAEMPGPVVSSGPDISAGPGSSTGARAQRVADAGSTRVRLPEPENSSVAIYAGSNLGLQRQRHPANSSDAPTTIEATRAQQTSGTDIPMPSPAAYSAACPDWSGPWTYTQFFNPLLDWIADPRSEVTLREIRLVAHVARHTWGFHRQWIGLTRADVARITGYDEGNAQKATKRLVANGVLLCHKEPGKTNRFALPVALTARQKDGAVDVAGPDEITLSHPDKKAGGSPRFFVGPDDSFFPNENNGIHADFRGLKKGSKERSKKISLSPSPSWQAYLAEQPSKERERISGIYFKLRAQYPDDLAVLDHAPDLAAQWGVPDGQPIRNLSALLGKSWPQVRDFWREKISTKINRELAQKQREQALLDARAEEETETRLIQETFAARYPQPTEQKEVLKRYSNGTFDVDTYAGRLAAMMRWWMQSGH